MYETDGLHHGELSRELANRDQPGPCWPCHALDSCYSIGLSYRLILAVVPTQLPVCSALRLLGLCTLWGPHGLCP